MSLHFDIGLLRYYKFRTNMLEEQTQPVLPTVLPTIGCQAFNNYTAEKVAAHVLPSDGFVNRYDPGGKYIAIGCNNGERLLYGLQENKMLEQVKDESQTPITCIRWRPTANSKSAVIGVGNAEGRFEYIHIPTMKRMFSVEEKDNCILCCDFSKTGEHFATAGKDSNIRVYDENTKSISTQMGNAQWNHSGHSNRIFSLKFIDENTVISGGWDSVVHIWDLRQAKSAQSFYGPHIAGDSIDVKGNTILTGCYATKSQLQLWDIRNLQQLQAITWPCTQNQVAYVYSACFSPTDPQQIVAGACGVNQVRVFSGENKHSTSVRVFDLKHGCFSVDGSHQSKEFCFSTAKQGFYIYRYGLAK